MYEYKARVVKVVDGDTLWLDVDLGFDAHLKMTVRLAGINTPELPTPEGVAAKEFVSKWLTNPDVILQTIKDKKEKYGRYLAHISYDGISTLNTALLDEGMAVPY